MIKNKITLKTKQGNEFTFTTWLKSKLNVKQAEHFINVEKKWGMEVLHVA